MDFEKDIFWNILNYLYLGKKDDQHLVSIGCMYRSVYSSDSLIDRSFFEFQAPTIVSGECVGLFLSSDSKIYLSFFWF
jgi:hypothetical protein